MPKNPEHCKENSKSNLENLFDIADANALQSMKIKEDEVKERHVGPVTKLELIKNFL